MAPFQSATAAVRPWYRVSARGRYDHLDAAQLRAQLERRDRLAQYGLVWERDGIEPDGAVNQDFVALDLVPELCAGSPAEGWRNLVVEGDNWDALRALVPGLQGKVNCILIDPPYNTGNRDFSYNDRFVGADDRYRESLWLEFIGRRLALARDLLASDGAILACINDENRARLDLLMERVFGRAARVGSFVWRTKDTNNSDKQRNWSGVHEHVLVYAREGFRFFGELAGAGKFQVRPELGDVPVRLDPVTTPKTRKERPGTYYPVQNPKTGLWYPSAPNQVWRFWSETKPPRGRPKRDESMEALIRAGAIYFPPETKPPFFYPSRAALDAAMEAGDVPRDGRRRPMLRPDLPDLDFWVGKPVAHGRLSRIVRWTPEMAEAARPVGSWIAGVTEHAADEKVETLHSDRQGAATTEIEHLFGEKVFSFPKPSSLVRALVRAAAAPDATVVDFFAGSGTTGEAVLAVNAADDGDRRFVLMSNTEATRDDPDRNLCRDVCAERLRRAMTDLERGPDNGFAYLRTRRVAPEDEPFDLDAARLWTLLQLREGLPVRRYDPTLPAQCVVGDAETPSLAYLPTVSDAALDALRQLATLGPVHAYTPTPGLLRDAVGLGSVMIEALPDRLLLDFKPHRTVAF